MEKVAKAIADISGSQRHINWKPEARAAIAVVLRDLHKLDPADDWQSLTGVIEWYARENNISLSDEGK